MRPEYVAQFFIALIFVSLFVGLVTYYITKSSILNEARIRYEGMLHSQLAAARTEARSTARKEAAIDFAGMVPGALVTAEDSKSEQAKAHQIEILMQEHRELLQSKVMAARQEALNEGREEVRKSLWYERRYFQTTEKDGIFKKSYFLVLEERVMLGQLAISGWVVHKTKLREKLDKEALDSVAAAAKGLCTAIGAALGHPGAVAGTFMQMKAAPKLGAAESGSEAVPLTANAINE